MNAMIRLCAILSVVIGISACQTTYKRSGVTEAQKKDTALVNDTTPKVTGVGGIFFFSDDPKKIRGWYSRNLGINATAYGATFKFRNNDRPEEVDVLQWSPFKTGNEYFLPSKKDFMINYRVQNLPGLLRKLKDSGVTVLDTVMNTDYGKFVHLLDPEGNKIELWEPVVK